MDLTKQANSKSYTFASEEFISEFVKLAKAFEEVDFSVYKMLESLEGGKIEQYNNSIIS